MSIANGQKANATNLNAAWISKSANSTTTGVIDLDNTADPDSGAQVENVQQAINETFDAAGITGIGDASRKVYADNNYVADGDSHKTAIGKLDIALDALATVVADLNPVETQFTIVDSQAVAADVTGLLLDKALIRYARIYWTVYREASGGSLRVQAGESVCIHDGTNWTLTDMASSPVDAGVILDIVAATGQIQYTSDANGGAYDALTSLLTWDIVHSMAL